MQNSDSEPRDASEKEQPSRLGKVVLITGVLLTAIAFEAALVAFVMPTNSDPEPDRVQMTTAAGPNVEQR